MSENKQHVSYGSCCAGSCGASKEITGCRFSLAPMSDQYVDIILDSLSLVDTGKVWSGTDALSTVCRGKAVHVCDTVKACFMHSYREQVHMTMEATFSKGCPGDTDAESYLAEDDQPANAAALKDIHFPVLCKIALYPMGITNYMEYIAHVVNDAIDRGIYVNSAHYATVIKGDVHDLFDYFEAVISYCGSNLSHYIFEVTLSVNSPTEGE